MNGEQGSPHGTGPHDEKGTDEESEKAMDQHTHDEHTDDVHTDDRATVEQVRAALGTVVAEAPAPPGMDAIAARIAARSTAAAGTTSTGPLPGQHAAGTTIPGTGTSTVTGYAAADIELEPSGAAAGSGPGRSAGSTRWPRILLAAAAIVALVGLGIAVIGGGDGDRDADVASEPGSTAGSIAGPVAAVPSTPPPGYALVWVSDTAVGGRTSMLRYRSDPALEPLVVTSTVVEPDSDVPETGESGSVERWGDRDVTVDEDGRRARFADPLGLLVQVTGEPADVAAVVPTLLVRAEDGWRDFLDEVSADIAALPQAVQEQLIPNGRATGHLTFDTVTTGPEFVSVSLRSTGWSGDTSSAPGRTGVEAGTCIVIDGVSRCRPTDRTAFVARDGNGVQTSFSLLIEGSWWEFGWSTTELAEVDLVSDARPDGTGVRFAVDSEPEVGPMTWFAAVLPEGATEATVELTGREGSSGFEQVRPAT